MQTSFPPSTPSTGTPEISSGGPSLSGFSELSNRGLFPSFRRADNPFAGIGAYVHATSGGTLNLTFWADESAEDAALRAQGLRLIVWIPSGALRDAVDGLQDVVQSYYRAPQALRPAPSARESASMGQLRERPPLMIQN